MGILPVPSILISTKKTHQAFYLTLIVIDILGPSLIFFIPPVPIHTNISLLQKLGELDWLGIILNAAIYCSWAIVLQFGGTSWEWSDGRTISCFVVTAVLIIAFTITRYYAVFTIPERRIFTGMFLKRRTAMLMFCSAVLRHRRICYSALLCSPSFSSLSLRTISSSSVRIVSLV